MRAAKQLALTNDLSVMDFSTAKARVQPARECCCGLMGRAPGC